MADSLVSFTQGYPIIGGQIVNATAAQIANFSTLIL